MLRTPWIRSRVRKECKQCEVRDEEGLLTMKHELVPTPDPRTLEITLADHADPYFRPAKGRYSLGALGVSSIPYRHVRFLA